MAFTILFLHGVSYPVGVAFSPACLVRLAPRLAGFAPPSLYPFDLRSVLAAVVLAGLADLDFVVLLAVAVGLVAAAVAGLVAAVADLGFVDFAAVVAAVASPSLSPDYIACHYLSGSRAATLDKQPRLCRTAVEQNCSCRCYAWLWQNAFCLPCGPAFWLLSQTPPGRPHTCLA